MASNTRAKAVIAIMLAAACLLATRRLQADDVLPIWQRPPSAQSQANARQENQAQGNQAQADTDHGTDCGCMNGLACPNPWETDDDDSCTGLCGLHEGLLPRAFRYMVNDRVWGDTALLGWSTRGMAVPALLTSSPAGTSVAQAGVIGQAGTRVLVGNEEIDSQFRTGIRVDLGIWLDPCHTTAIEANYLSIGQAAMNYDTGINETRIFARPFFNMQTNANDSEVVNLPGQSSGDFLVHAASEFQATEFLWRRLIASGPAGRFDMLFGYRYQQLSDTLSMTEDLSVSGAGGTFPAGTVARVNDEFITRDIFNGIEFGVSNQFRGDRLTFDTALKIAAGDVHSKVTIQGATAAIVGGQTPAAYGVGVLALPSNSGVYQDDQFSIVPEASAAVGWRITPHIKMSVGYTLIYWTNVARPGDQIDTRLDPGQIPPSTNGGNTPVFRAHNTDYWAQGGNVSLEYRF